MEEIKLWKIDTNGNPKAMCVETIAETSTERLLEDVLTSSPDLLTPNLRLIGRQTDTSGGPLDLLGVDEDGRLVVFELKRGNLTRDAVAQAIDYASFLASLEPETLFRHINQNSGKNGTESVGNFSTWYQDNYQRSAVDIGRPRVMLVGLGVDERAKRMVKFLAECDLDISLITFHGFKEGGETLLARQVEVRARTQEGAVKSTKLDNQNKLDKLLTTLGIKSTYDEIANIIKLGLGASTYQWPNPTGHSFYLPEILPSGGPTTRSYVTLVTDERQRGRIQLHLYPRAVEPIGEENLRHFASSMGSQFVLKPTGYGEIWIDTYKPVTEYAPALTALIQAIAAAWKEKREAQAKAEAEESSSDA